MKKSSHMFDAVIATALCPIAEHFGLLGPQGCVASFFLRILF